LRECAYDGKEYRLTFTTRFASSAIGVIEPRDPIASTKQDSVPALKKEEGTGCRHLSFWLKRKTCVMLAWKKEEGSRKLHYRRVDAPCHLLLLPIEIKLVIAHYALLSETGEVHISEAAGQMHSGKIRITSSNQMPRGGRDEAFFGDALTLRHSFNSIKSMHPHFESCRGHELLYNTLVCNGYSFDSFIKYTHKKDIFKHVREVRLCGEFGLGLYPDENILHPLMRFGQANKQANIKIEIDCMVLRSSGDLRNFMRLVYCIRAFMRALPRPAWLKVNKKDELTVWLRGKEPGEMFAKNIHFHPKGYASWDEEKDPWRVRKMLTGRSLIKDSLKNEYGG
jgi:hypothetical protein